MRHVCLSLVLALGCTAPAGDTSVADSGGDTGGGDTAPAPTFNGTPPETPVALPTFTARNQHGETRTDADLRGHPTVLWFYPAAGTFG